MRVELLSLQQHIIVRYTNDTSNYLFKNDLDNYYVCYVGICIAN